MSTLLKDLRYGLRMLARSPGSTVVAMIALALGIGANSAIFSVVNAVLLRPLPYKDASRLIVIWETKLSKGILQEQVSPPDYRDWVEQQRVFEKTRRFPGTACGSHGRSIARARGNSFHIAERVRVVGC